MIWKISLSLLVALVQVLVIPALMDSGDVAALYALKYIWKNVPLNWAAGNDPCGYGWEGITCINSRVVSITLASINLSGQLSSDITRLSELQILDLSYNKGITGPLPSEIGNLKKLSSLALIGCGFYGPIPPSIGSLQQLVKLSLNSNKFDGQIPASIGNLSSLYWLDISDNKFTGTIPVSDESTPGLDMLLNAKHFHFGKNQLSGQIPSQLFTTKLALLHLLLEDNDLTGNIPYTLGYMQTLEIVDMSNNSFHATDIPPWFSSLQFLTTLVMENTQIQGQLPVSLFSLFQLQNVTLKNNQINGTLDIGSSYSSQLQVIDLQNNSIDTFAQRAGYTARIILVENPICKGGATENYCSISQHSNNPPYSEPQENCAYSLPCRPDQIPSPSCNCAFPYTGTLFFRAPSFSNYGNSTHFSSLNRFLIVTFRSHGLPVDSLLLRNPTKDVNDYLVVDLLVFPSGQDYFNRTGISGIAYLLSNQFFEPPPGFGPYFFIGDIYPHFEDPTVGSDKSSNTGIIIGTSVGGAILFLVLLLVGVYVFRRKMRVETAAGKNDPFASWDSNKNSGQVPQLKGTKCFSFDELKRCTDNFSEFNDIGSGGYGKVYRGTLTSGQMVAIKRAQQGSSQGGLEFKTEIELLSRVHHKNVVSLVGFCFEQGEQILVYEYVANGTLKNCLSGKTGIRLDWIRRLRIALGAARGLQYLHDHANPPIIHRDIKSNNILLDERLNAKVADFGLSKLMDDSGKGHVTTQVKGTMGYLDPEYYMTQKLTEKSDVYSFGVLLLELLTSRSPIENGKYIVREVKQAMDVTKEMYNLHGIVDQIVASTVSPKSIEKFVDLALVCVRESAVDRPTMSEVVKDLENVAQIVGLNPNSESASTSASYEGANKGLRHPYSNESLFAYSGAYLPSRLGSS